MMAKIKSSLLALLVPIVVLSACTTTPPPSRFSGISWYDGRKYVYADAYVRNGKFVPKPGKISETIALDGLYATSPYGQPLPIAGMPADFDLYAKLPENGAEPVARIRGGKLVR